MSSDLTIDELVDVVRPGESSVGDFLWPVNNHSLVIQFGDAVSPAHSDRLAENQQPGDTSTPILTQEEIAVEVARLVDLAILPGEHEQDRGI